MTKTGVVPALLVLLLSACAHQSADTDIRPLVDHHQHLFSPALVQVVNRALPAVELPPDVAKVLGERAARWDDAAGLATLYTEDALVLSSEPPGWLRGRTAAADYLSRRFARAYRITPVQFDATDRGARVAAYFSRGEGDELTHFGYALFDLEKDGDSWRIAAETPAFPGPSRERPMNGEGIVRMLDEAGIQRAIVLSNAYAFDSDLPGLGVHDVAKARAENDWTASEAAKHPTRLVAFCSVNPLAEWALPELDRCAANETFRGLKLHLRASGVDLDDPQHVQRLRGVFEAANRHRLPIITHVRAHDTKYGRGHARTLLDQVFPAAPDIHITIAHLWGGEQYSEEALTAFAEAVEARHPSTRNLTFEVAQMQLVLQGRKAELQTVANLMRRIGMQRIYYGSDGAFLGGQPPREMWSIFRRELPLTSEEFAAIARNVAPYLR